MGFMQDVFQSKPLATALLAAHVGLLLIFADRRWCAEVGGLVSLWRQFWRRAVCGEPLPRSVQGRVHSARPENSRGDGESSQQSEMQALDPKHVLLVLFSGNFVGIVCARTLHYQFYAWYFHTVPLLLWAVRIPTVLRVGLWALIEVIWNVYPPRALTSATLLVCHVILLAALWARPVTLSAPEGMSRKHRAD